MKQVYQKKPLGLRLKTINSYFWKYITSILATFNITNRLKPKKLVKNIRYLEKIKFSQHFLGNISTQSGQLNQLRKDQAKA